MKDLLLHPVFMALGIPMLLLFAGSVAKKIVRGPGWTRKDFFLGVEFTLAAMSSAFIHVFDLARRLPSVSQTTLADTVRSDSALVQGQMNLTAGFVVVCFIVFLFVLSTHQDWETRDNQKTKQIMWLVFFSNLLGGGLMASFILLVKGVQS